MSNGGSSSGRGCNADWVKVENDLFELSHEIKPIFKTRSDNGYTINYQLSKSIENTLQKIKGKIDMEISEAGDLDVNEFIRFKVDKKAGTIQDFNLFETETEVNGIDIILLIESDESSVCAIGGC